MTELGVRDAAAKVDKMVDPALLATSMIEERAPDIVEALNDMAVELAVAVLLYLPPDRAIEVLDQPGLEREPELVTLMPMRPSIAPRASPLGISRSDGRA